MKNERNHCDKFGFHQSEMLKNAFNKKYWQGQHPQKAKIIFLGLDANWDKNIESNPELLNIIINYLQDGVSFWEQKEIHHPSLLPEYKKQSGSKYHFNFRKMNLSSNYAKHISFVELHNKPTYGNASKCRSKFIKEIDINHLRKLNDIFISNKKKIIFLPKSVLNIIYRIKKSHGLNDCFNFALNMEPHVNYLNKLMNIHSLDNTLVYIHTHFSNAISDYHLYNIEQTIKSFLNNRNEKIWWEITYVYESDNKRIEETRFIYAKDAFEVVEILHKHLNPNIIKTKLIQFKFAIAGNILKHLVLK